MEEINGQRDTDDRSTQMLPADALFWYAEQVTPALRPFVAGLLVLDREPDTASVRAAVLRLLGETPRLRQRVSRGRGLLGLPAWEEDPGLDIDYHLRETAVPEPRTLAHLLDLLGTVVSIPLDPLRPLWESHLVRGLEGGRAAYFFKAHHALVDGVGCLELFERLTQAGRGEGSAARNQAAMARGVTDDTPPSVRTAPVWRGASAMLAPGLEQCRHAVRHPLEISSDLAKLFGGVRSLLNDVFVTAVKDPLSDGGGSLGRRLATHVVSLEKLQQLNEACGVTLNDLILVALSGALERYYEGQHTRVGELRCLVPMSLPRDTEPGRIGNHLAMANVRLPIAARSPRSRLALIHRQTHTAKIDGRKAAVPILLQALPVIPTSALRAFLHRVSGRTNLMCTNMRGPEEARRLAGAEVEVIYPFAPLMFGTPLSIACVSYADTCALGITTDSGVIPEPGRLATHFGEALEEVEERLGSPASPARRPGQPLSAATRRASSRFTAGRRCA